MTSENQFLITVSGVDGFFATKSGGHASRTVTKDYDGGSDTPDISLSRKAYEDLVVGRRYDATRDATAAIALEKQIGSARTVKVQPCDVNFVPVGPSKTYTCILTKVTDPDANANGANPARFSLTLAVSKVL
jgi:hypothetical protein